MTKRIFHSVMISCVLVIAVIVTVVMGSMYAYFTEISKNNLKKTTQIVAYALETSGEAFLEGFQTSEYRITWISPYGVVLYDNIADSDEMENHLDREEVKSAFETGSGYSIRNSKTITARMLYYAIKLSDNSVVRLAVSQSTIAALLFNMLPKIAVVVLICLVLSYFLARRLSRKIVKPLNELSLDDPLSNEGYDELSLLFQRIDLQQKRIEQMRNELIQKQEEFEAVTGNMNEGLVLLNDKGTILSINHSAKALLGANDNSVGDDIYTLNRTYIMQKLIEETKEKGKAERIININDRIYQINAGKVVSEEKTSGIALLMFDVTENKKAAKERSEFTANVSHELKTPLHSISGCAELLLNDMVKKEDEKRFYSQIYNDSKRMIKLVDDIIKLSELDEGNINIPFEPVDLFEIIKAEADNLKNAAEKAKVTLTIKGESAVMCAYARLLQAIVHNLADNAIKYNHKGGYVVISVINEEKYCVLRVADNAVGMSPQDTKRVFERFYRVDKSRSNALGSTGLGLSIVKHAAMMHNAEISLESALNEGTTVTIRFPKGKTNQ